MTCPECGYDPLAGGGVRGLASMKLSCPACGWAGYPEGHYQ